jgi:hypothetical protein
VLGDLQNVDETGAGAGEALVSDGAGAWGPSAAAVILEGDARLTDARTPTDDSVDADALADGDLGDVSVSGGVVTVDSGAVGITELGDDATCSGEDVVRRNAGDTAFECAAASGGANPAGSGSELQFRSDATTFGAVTGSSVSGSDVTLSGVMRADGGYLGGGATTFPTASYNFNHSVPSNGLAQITGANNVFLRVNGSASNRSATIQLASGGTVYGQINHPGSSDYITIGTGINAATLALTLDPDDGVVVHLPSVNYPSTVTCTDEGTGATGALVITTSTLTSNVLIVASDPDGCLISLSETGAVGGQFLDLTLSSTAGGTVSVADSSGVAELAGGVTFTFATVGDAITFRYQDLAGTSADAWYERSRVNF